MFLALNANPIDSLKRPTYRRVQRERDLRNAQPIQRGCLTFQGQTPSRLRQALAVQYLLRPYALSEHVAGHAPSLLAFVRISRRLVRDGFVGLE